MGRRSKKIRHGIGVSAALLAIGTAGIVIIEKRSNRVRQPSVVKINSFTQLRPVYRYSVIPGGAYSAVELRAKLRWDEVAAGHYQPFDLARLRTIESKFSVPVYFSYRVDHAIYWTRRPMRIPNGEVLLTDGRLYARTRCGNRISETPLGPTILPPEAEPTQAAFDDLEKQEEPQSTPALLSAVAGVLPQPSPDTSGPPESTRTSRAKGIVPIILVWPIVSVMGGGTQSEPVFDTGSPSSPGPGPTGTRPSPGRPRPTAPAGPGTPPVSPGAPDLPPPPVSGSPPGSPPTGAEPPSSGNPPGSNPGPTSPIADPILGQPSGPSASENVSDLTPQVNGPTGAGSDFPRLSPVVAPEPKYFLLLVPGMAWLLWKARRP